MQFISTRGKDSVSCSAQAIAKGLAHDGGLFVPEKFPLVNAEEFNKMLDMDYAQRACLVLHKYLEEYDYDELLAACIKAYDKFEDSDAAPIVKIDESTFIMELFHGPTLAFKDVALTLLPYLMRKGCDISGIKDEILILTATSGDTGKAALEGFKGADGIKVMVFFPSDGVSEMQKLQMCTQEGDNVKVVAVKGNFDDCQTAVKNIFSDKEFNAKLKDDSVVLSSANSMNFGRLAPQIAYYFSAYCDLVNSEEIKMGDKINFVVPTGNFGNILAGYYAKQMGLPVNKLICASNDNNVLTEFFADGTYDTNREFFKTISPSMDIIISSNLERLIFELCGRDAAITEKRMLDLKKIGNYSLEKAEKEKIDKEFFADFADEEDCKETIADFYDENGYVLDTHTAVAVSVKNSYVDFTGDETPTVVLSTASPYKFSHDVLSAIDGKAPADPFKCADKLFELSATPIPTQISELKTKEIRFKEVIDKTQTFDAVLSFLNK
ncbi:MAG: threonine synthase [Clostridiales bacterium]|nr:threonine synthase [Clostridiales bacterium]